MASFENESGSDKGLWEGGVIPYELSRTHEKYELIASAIKEINQKTVLNFVEKEPADDAYVVFTSEPGAQRANGIGSPKPAEELPWVRTVNINKDYRIMHELGHAIGLIHEHQRSDRDQHLTVILGNLADPNDNQIVCTRSVGTHSMYDINSVMHYWWNAGAAHSARTLTYLKEPDLEFLTPNNLSKLDIETINTAYTEGVVRGQLPLNDENYSGPLKGMYVDEHEVLCPSGSIVRGMRLNQKMNRVVLEFGCVNTEGVLEWVSGFQGDDRHYFGPLEKDYLDQHLIRCPRTETVTGAKLWRMGNRLAIKLRCTDLGGKHTWVKQDSVHDHNYSGPLSTQYLDKNDMCVTSGKRLEGAALWRRGNRVALELREVEELEEIGSAPRSTSRSRPMV